MRRGTTPSFVLHVDGEDLREYRVFVTIDQNGKQLELTNERLAISYDEDGGTTEIGFDLTQADTLGFAPASARVQVRAVNQAGNAVASNIGSINIQHILKDGVIEYA